MMTTTPQRSSHSILLSCDQHTNQMEKTTTVCVIKQSNIMYFSNVYITQVGLVLKDKCSYSSISSCKHDDPVPQFGMYLAEKNFFFAFLELELS
jgi:hypothetical protein